MEALPPNTHCAICGVEGASFRCLTCIGGPLCCQECCVGSHQHDPFHKIQEWKDGFFQSVHLRNLGFILHLGHCGKECLNSAGFAPLPPSCKTFPHEDILLVDVAGVELHRVAWCNCPERLEKPFQLIQMGLYPATLKNTATAFSFQVLDHFYLDSLESHTSAMSFYSKLRRLTNNIDPDSVPVRFWNSIVILLA